MRRWDALPDEAVRRAKSMAGLEERVLAVTVGNASAKQLYLSAGFKVYFVTQVLSG
ncbi:MAG: hypothetical protein AVDCRST_MAG86-243 [uncultured Truepera sp.]|uniref:N-acetyltransferase domain-containing protein n=1 Tax=uncultured Truepera sp. TaxID=543023 RepID=A0A6J4US44_9DEIN|nr:MAG: hypothetical protein AVDCRST_MAG86-243 [uncultured Truepera sp.]